MGIGPLGGSDFFQVGPENSLYLEKVMNMNLKQKINDSNCNFYHFSLTVPCPNELLYILIFYDIVELKNFLFLVASDW